MTRLAECSRLQTTALSRRIVALEAEVWLEHTADESDGRARLVSVTPAGRRMIQHTRDEARRELAGAWDEVTHEE